MLIIGGTGSLGKSLIRHFIKDYNISVFSRDEAKHVVIKQMYPEVKSLIGDIRDRDAIFNALLRSIPDVIINAAALKNVPEVEEVPMEGIKTSLIGTDNLISAIRNYAIAEPWPLKVLSVSTDKAAKPVNSYGMSKALQERLHIRANSPNLICNAVRYGNVLESRGSLIPLIKERFSNGQSVCITHPQMTRFFLTLDRSVDLIKTALEDNEGGKIFVPNIRSAKISDIVEIFRDFYCRDKSQISITGIRPGEKIDEILISQEELLRTKVYKDTFVIHDILSKDIHNEVTEEFSSGSSKVLLTKEELTCFLAECGLLNEH